MPLHRRIPKRGFTNHMRKDYVVVNLGDIQKAIDAKKLDAKAVIDGAALVAAGLLRSHARRCSLAGQGYVLGQEAELFGRRRIRRCDRRG